jgi:excisionase family DNA binding protein
MALITTKKAAELLGISAVRVRQLITAGQLKSEKAGRDAAFFLEPSTNTLPHRFYQLNLAP